MPKYGDLFKLHPIETVIKITEADNKTKAKRLVSTFVVTPSLGEQIINVALPQLDLDSGVEGKGIFFVGNYGTGKSHVMSFLSLIAENAEFLADVRDEVFREKLRPIAGKFKVRRQQISGTLMSLYDIVAEQLTILATELGFSFTFKSATKVSNVKDEFQRFMQAFEQHPGCSDKGVLLIFDELLHYLETRNDQDLVLDLSVLQALGEFRDEARFLFMGGIQQALFNNPRFNHMASAVNRVRQRFHDFVIDSKGVEQLVEQYLFHKTEAQKQAIREHFQQQIELYEVVSPDIERFVSLFPAHPRFIDEFQRVFVVERREILTVLSKEARDMLDHEIDTGKLELITADKYWKHIERDQGLKANRDVAKVIQNVSTISAHINSNFGPNEDKEGAIRLIQGLAVNRLTTPSVTDPVGMTPAELKNNLLWRTKIAMPDPNFLTLSAKRLLDRSREAVNGQFLAVSSSSGQYYIDPTRDVDYEQHVNSRSKIIGKDVVQRYLNELFTRALELDNTQPVIEGRLWEYRLPWPDKHVERPGWLFFGFPNQRSTAKPPKDFYVFVVPSKRVTGMQESWADNPDETYWFVEDFPLSNFESGDDNKPDEFLDQVRKYAAAREWAKESRGDEKAVYDRIAKRLLESALPAFTDNAGTWVSVQFNGQKKRFGDWVADLAPSQQTALFKTRFNAVLQSMFAAHFDNKYPNYPVFAGHSIQEDTRAQNAQAALEIICGTGMTTKAGKSVLSALGLYDDSTPTPERSAWLQIVRDKLEALPDGQVLNNSDLFERREDRAWMRGEAIEAEWLHVVVAAGVEAGYFMVFGPNNAKYDAASLREFYQQVKTWEQIVRVAKPVGVPLDKWRKLFGGLGLNQGLLANPSTHGDALTQFRTRVSESVLGLVDLVTKLGVSLPFLSDDDAKAAIANHAGALEQAKATLESLTSLDTKAKMTNLRLEMGQIEQLTDRITLSQNVSRLLAFIQQNQSLLGALLRYESILAGFEEFQAALDILKTRLNVAYAQLGTFSETQAAELAQGIRETASVALKNYREAHKRHSLDRDGDTRKKKLLQGTELKQLNKLAQVKALNKGALDELHTSLSQLPLYQGCSDDELLNSPTSLCPITKFDPRHYAGAEPAVKVLERCEQLVERLHKEWTGQLLKELKDPAVIASLSALKPEEKRIVDAFLASEQLPESVDDAFVAAVNTVLSGLKRKRVKVTGFAEQVFGGGVPLKAEEVRARFEAWLKQELGQDQPETIRFVMEE